MSLWTYRARLDRVVDADTLDLLIDVGFHHQCTQRVRLVNIDAPETRGRERTQGLAAKHYVDQWLTACRWAAERAGADWPLHVVTSKHDSFGRWLADITAPYGPDNRTLSDALLQDGHAKEWTR